MKKTVTVIMLVITMFLCSFSIMGCSDKDNCIICGGSGYYQKKDCPGC
ncbi:MAG: hypothetical protein J6Q52_06365 [Clostridia bacterium]|nr:hypothetical protein [Clostridia bacterium]